MGLDFGWKNGLVMWPPMFTWHAGLMYFETATEMALIGSKIGLRGASIFGATFCVQFGLIMTSAAPIRYNSPDTHQYVTS